MVYYALGDFEKMRALCEAVGESVKNFQDCLALAYHKLGRQADAETALARFKGVSGQRPETALQLRDSELINLRTDPLLDPLRQEPRFKAIERELSFPP